ncbi:hypothetical protein NDU88_001434 [Pleurodeles waltl]|uniref:Uncharacterized protein n=1 Tax=Pleurodeles waltl TaxID=8319 RepID=A0AAV7L9G8_PLEWA|nr:hypothetical protein NDU88_001434 [Pleurodeles waltl]
MYMYIGRRSRLTLRNAFLKRRLRLRERGTSNPTEKHALKFAAASNRGGNGRTGNRSSPGKFVRKAPTFERKCEALAGSRRREWVHSSGVISLYGPRRRLVPVLGISWLLRKAHLQ